MAAIAHSQSVTGGSTAHVSPARDRLPAKNFTIITYGFLTASSTQAARLGASRGENESMQNRGGRSGCCWKRLVIVGGPEARIAMAEGVLSVSFSTAVRTSRKGCTLALLQRICCLLFRRLATISLTALSTNAVEIGSPRRRRAA